MRLCITKFQSTIKMTDINGTVQNTYDYDPYGTLLNSTGSVQNPWRYAGSYYDYQTDLYKMGARYYNSTDARWTQLDPSGAETGYVYAGGDPVNLVDTSGYLSVSGVTAGIGAAVGTSVLIGLCPATAGLGCAVAAGAFGGFVGGFYGSLLGGGSTSQASDDAIYGGVGGAAGGFLKLIKL